MAHFQDQSPGAPRDRRRSSAAERKASMAGRRASTADQRFSVAPDPTDPAFAQRDPETHPRRLRKKFILCFDGTGNKFSGTDSDSNILKIYRMLDRDDSSQFHYYQPGIGTYVEASSLSHSSRLERLKLWYSKAKDSAVGTSFDQHVMGGYKFLMRYYNVGDDIFLFGFSRGAYTARFLAEMLDHIGLLSAGNEEMGRFAWKAFQKWQTRKERTEKEKAQKKYLMNYMFAFRETFSRPVHRIRFLGLFDTVNSVPHFENAWMQRSKFPYTARSTAKVIRHAVAIDERRAKFRQDLISELKPTRETRYRRRHHYFWEEEEGKESGDKDVDGDEELNRGRASIDSSRYLPAHRALQVPVFRDPSEVSGIRSLSPNMSTREPDERSVASDASQDSLAAIRKHHGDFADEDSDGEEQDIQEVWFPGCHADIGGGWPIEEGEHTALSHVPLVWMVREAEKAGLHFDPKKVRALNCSPDDQPRRKSQWNIPQIEIDGEPARSNSIPTTIGGGNSQAEGSQPPEKLSHFHHSLHMASTLGKIHDVLCFNNGTPHTSVLAWNIMEYLPFRRMDLQPDGSWKSITWPLPKGEVRDIPDDVVIHGSVLRRMEADPNYRPGNLIVGGGGRGVRRAPEHMGMGKWKILREEGDPVGECWVRAEKPQVQRQGSGLSMSGIRVSWGKNKNGSKAVH